MALPRSNRPIYPLMGRRASRDEREILATIAETTDAFIQVADLNFRWLAINKASADEFERIFGVKPQVGMSMLDVLADKPEHQAAVRAVWERALNGEEFTEVGEFGEAERRFYEMKYNTLRDASGTRIGAFQIVTDVTDRVLAEEALQRAEADLRQSQKMEALGQLTGGLAHDFNNMLQVISGNLELLRQRLQSADGRTMRLLDGAARGADRAGNLTKRLLAFAKPTLGLQQVVDANAVISSMSDLIRQAVGRGIHVEMKLIEDTAYIRADPSQLEAAIFNLVVNARDAMPAGGKLTISTAVGAREDLPPNIDYDPDIVSIVIAVADTGEGMEPETVARAFEPFFTTKLQGHGTGLGLAMVYQAVSIAGGHIQILSQPGKGSVFRLGFPRAQAEDREEMADSAHRASLIRQDCTVLLVEEDWDVRQHCSEALRNIGCRVLEAHNEKAALSLLAKHRDDVQLLLCDLGLADGEDGFSLFLKARSSTPGLPVLFMSGASQEQSVTGPSGDRYLLLSKPFSSSDLGAKVSEILEHSNART